MFSQPPFSCLERPNHPGRGSSKATWPVLTLLPTHSPKVLPACRWLLTVTGAAGQAEPGATVVWATRPALAPAAPVKKPEIGASPFKNSKMPPEEVQLEKATLLASSGETLIHGAGWGMQHPWISWQGWGWQLPSPHALCPLGGTPIPGLRPMSHTPAWFSKPIYSTGTSCGQPRPDKVGLADSSPTPQPPNHTQAALHAQGIRLRWAWIQGASHPGWGPEALTSGMASVHLRPPLIWMQKWDKGIIAF